MRPVDREEIVISIRQYIIREFIDKPINNLTQIELKDIEYQSHLLLRIIEDHFLEMGTSLYDFYD